MEPKKVSSEQKQLWRRRLIEKSGTFAAIFVFNVATLLLLGGSVIIHILSQEISEPVQTFKVKPVPPPPRPPAHGGDAARSLADPSVTVVPPTVSMPSIIVSTLQATFNIKAADVPVFNGRPFPALPILPQAGEGVELPVGVRRKLIHLEDQ